MQCNILEGYKMKQNDYSYPFAVPLVTYIIDKHNNNQSEFARSIGVQQSQITRWLKLDCIVVNGELYRKIKVL